MKRTPAIQWLTLIVFLLAGVAAHADILIYNTGVDSSGNVLPNSIVDPHYTFFSGSDLVDSSISATPPSDTLSAWIRPASFLGPGSYPTYTSFNYDTAGVPITINGRWAALTGGIGISLNSQNNGAFSTPTPGNLDWSPFSLTGTTVAGNNVLSFFPYSDGTPPTGLRVEIDSVLVPEPACGALFVISTAILVRRHRSSKVRQQSAAK